MDRHDVPGVTAKDLAEAHVQDLDIQDNYRCKSLTYWFDEGKGLVFCLIEAPDKEAVVQMHRNSHGLIPHQIIEVEGNIVELFLGRILDPVISKKQDEFENFINETAFRTIMYLDYKSPLLTYSNKSEVTEILSDIFNRFNGREVKYIYEGQMATFTSINNSVNCAIEILKELKEYSTAKGFNTFPAIGLSTGVPVTDRDDFFGETIISAKWFCEIADEGQIVITSAIKNLCNDPIEDHSIKVLNPADEKFLNQLMKITELVWNDADLNIDNFSRQIGISKAQLYRKTISLTGLSPNEFIREYRLNKALKLIEKKKGNISEIAFESGFGTLSYFSKCFQKRFDILPSDYAGKIE